MTRWRAPPLPVARQPHCRFGRSPGSSRDEAPAAATERRPLPHRRWHRDRPDLPRRARASRVRGVRPAQGHGGHRRPAPLLRAVSRARDGTRRRLYRREPDVARESPLGAELGYSDRALDSFNRKAIELMEELKRPTRGPSSAAASARARRLQPIRAAERHAAEAYHATQIATFATTAADMVTAITMTYTAEAIGIANAATGYGLPVAISFTVETDGRLPSGQSLATRSAGRRRDRRRARLLHGQLRPPDPLRACPRRALGRAHPRPRANASARSARGARRGHRPSTRAIRTTSAPATEPSRPPPRLNVLGGCCGTDHRHVQAIAGAWE